MAWCDHLQRKPINRIPKRLLNYRPAGRRSIGRPRKRWIDEFETWTRNRPKGLIEEDFDDYDDDDNLSNPEKKNRHFPSQAAMQLVV
jgi:hypothetical protein